MSTPRFLAVMAALSVSLAACDLPASSRVADATGVSAGAAHNWLFHEDGAYGYALNEKRGLIPASTRAPVATFRYLGLIDGEYQLDIEDAEGTIASCANPCTNIRYIREGETIQKAPFDPQSVIGAVFTDAFKGRLEVYQLPPPEMEHAALSTSTSDPGALPSGDGPEPIPQGALPADSATSSEQASLAGPPPPADGGSDR